MRDAEKSILKEAQSLVYGDREAAYGDARADMERVALMWSAILGVTVEARQVPLCMVAVKLSRLAHAANRDSYVDVAGWADVGAQVAQDMGMME